MKILYGTAKEIAPLGHAVGIAVGSNDGLPVPPVGEDDNGGAVGVDLVGAGDGAGVSPSRLIAVMTAHIPIPRTRMQTNNAIVRKMFVRLLVWPSTWLLSAE
jgi:hypothetical protein